MRLQRFSNFILKHRLVALVLTFAVTFVPVFGIFGIIVAAFMTLTKGVIEGAIFTLAATIPYFITLGLPPYHTAEAPLVVWAAIVVAVLSNLLTWIFAVMLRRQSTWSQMIQVAALMGVLVVSVVHLANPNIDDWWGQQLQTYYAKAETVTKALDAPAPAATTPTADEVTAATAAPVAKEVVAAKVDEAKQAVTSTIDGKLAAVAANAKATTNPASANLTNLHDQAVKTISTTTSTADADKTNADLRTEAINETKQYATGLMLAAILFNALLQLVVARWWQSALYYPRGLRRELHGIRLSFLASVLFVAALVLAYIGNTVVIDMLPIIYVLFTAAGLSLIHWMFGMNRSNTTWFWIMILYVGLIISIPTSLVFISSLAAVDVWLNIRKRLRKF